MTATSSTMPMMSVQGTPLDPSAEASLDLSDAGVLRAHGWDDVAIHDAIQVIGYFNYINRIADAVGVEDEPEWGEEP